MELERILEDWKQIRHDFELVKELLNSPRLEQIWSFFDQINTSLYYYFTIDPSNQLIAEVTSSDVILQNIVRGSIFGVILIGGLFSFHTIVKLKKRFVDFYSVLYVMPKELIEENSVLMYMMKKVKEGKVIG